MNAKKIIKDLIGEDLSRTLLQLKYLNEDKYTKSIIKKSSTERPSFELENLKSNVLCYVDSLKINDFEYLFSKSSTVPTLYSSVYACMIKGLLDDIDDDFKVKWIEFFDSFQNESGLFIDPVHDNERFLSGDGWGARHLLPHIIIAYKRLGGTPSKEFSYLNHLNKPDKMIKWLESLDYTKVWASSNAIMNYGVAMQYARDYMGMPINDSIEAMQTWLLKKVREDSGMWFDGDLGLEHNRYEAIRGAYHIYPILVYDGIEIPHANRALDLLLSSQNKWGGFDKYIGSSACDDIDAIDPIIRIANQLHQYKNPNINEALRKAASWIMVNQNNDGGFVFDRRNRFSYGGEKELSSKKQQSNMFATWFRMLSLLYIHEFAGNSKTRFIDIPGYEMPIFKCKKGDC